MTSERQSLALRLTYPGAMLIAVAAGLVLGRATAAQQAKLLALALVLTAIVVAFFQPKFALAFVVALVPFQLHASGAGIHTGTNEVLVIAVALSSLRVVSLAVVPRPVKIASLLIVLGGLFSAGVAVRADLALWGTVRWLCVLVLLFAAFRIRPIGRARDIAAALVSATGIVVLAFGLMQKAGGFFFVGEPYLADRIDSTFDYYTQFGAYMAVVALVAMNQLAIPRDDRRVAPTILHLAGAVAGLAGAALSLSRGAALVLGVGLLWTLVLRVRQPRRLVRVVTVLCVVGIAGFAVVPTVARQGLTVRLTDKTASKYDDAQRSALRRLGVQALEHNPLGIGYGNFPTYIHRHANQLGIERSLFHSHWLPIQFGLDTGWVGLFGFLILVLWPLGVGARRAWSGSGDAQAAGFAGALAGLLAQGWYEYLFAEISFLVVFCLLVWGAFPRIASGVRAQLA